jgi:predicted methyltransferase
VIRPLLTSQVNEAMLGARRAGVDAVDCSLDLGRSNRRVDIGPDEWALDGARYPYLDGCRERTIYWWSGAGFEPAARYGRALVKLVPTEWGPPTFEIDGIKMLPTAQVSPWDDAVAKVARVRPRGKVVLDTCGGLGYFAACCMEQGAAQVRSYERSPEVLWLRTINPWSPAPGGPLVLTEGDVAEAIATLSEGSAEAVLHDPPRFGIAGELYSQAFYDQLARVLVRRGRLFHYTGTPNRLTTGRDVPVEVARRLKRAGFSTEPSGDGVLAIRR